MKKMPSITVSKADIDMMRRIEQFILNYESRDFSALLRDIDLNFPRASFTAFFLAFSRSQDPARWFEPEGHG